MSPRQSLAHWIKASLGRLRRTPRGKPITIRRQAKQIRLARKGETAMLLQDLAAQLNCDPSEVDEMYVAFVLSRLEPKSRRAIAIKWLADKLSIDYQTAAQSQTKNEKVHPKTTGSKPAPLFTGAD